MAHCSSRPGHGSERAWRASHAAGCEPSKRRARARVGESEGRSPSDHRGALMGLTRDQRRALEAARKEAIRGYQAEKRRRRHIEAFERARTRAENKFKRGMADRLLAAAGLDRRGVEEQVDRDHTAV